jgi:signal peptidase I
VKRIIGIPGDRIHLHDGKVYRNGEALNEPYVHHSGQTMAHLMDMSRWERMFRLIRLSTHILSMKAFVRQEQREKTEEKRKPA